jgi:hypothetical protein
LKLRKTLRGSDAARETVVRTRRFAPFAARFKARRQGTRPTPKRAVEQTPFKLRRKILRFVEKESFITNYNAVVRIRNKHFWKITIICIKTARTKRQNRKKK